MVIVVGDIQILHLMPFMDTRGCVTLTTMWMDILKECDCVVGWFVYVFIYMKCDIKELEL